MRPKRLYLDKAKDKYYYLVNGKKKFIRIPEGISQKQIVKINIGNLEKKPSRRIKKRKKKVEPKIVGKPSLIEGLKSFTLPATSLPYRALSEKIESKDKETEKDIEKIIKKLIEGTKQITPEPETSPVKATPVKATPVKAKSITPISDFWRNVIFESPYKMSPLSSMITGTPESMVVEDVPKKKKSRDTEEESKRIFAQEESKKREAEAEAMEAQEQISKELTELLLKEGEGELSPDDSTLKSNIIDISEMLELKKLDRTFLDIPKNKELRITILDRLRKKLGDDKFIPMKGQNNLRNFYLTIQSNYNFNRIGMGLKDGEGLWNDEIENILKKNIKDTIPVIAIDQIDNLEKVVEPGLKRFGFVVNTAKSSSDGTGENGNSLGHWIGVYINNEDDYPSIEWYDSLALGNPKPTVLSSLKKIARKINPEYYFKLKVNNLQTQPDNSPHCGYHAIKFLDDRYNAISFEEASGYSDFIDKFKPDFSELEKEKIKEFKSYL